MANRMNQTLSAQWVPHFKDRFVVLVLDNEVTVDQFVTHPPLPWIRMVEREGAYRVAFGYPTKLTSEQAEREKLNWDQVSHPAILQALNDLGGGVDYVVFGNNAAQGFPLAQRLPSHWRAEKAAVLYGSSLPEQETYEAEGYRIFRTRSDLIAHVRPLAESAGKPLALVFINTIQHNEANFHVPWTGRSD